MILAIPAVPFIVYKFMAIIIKKGGWALLTLIVGLVGQGVLKSSKDIKNFLDKN